MFGKRDSTYNKACFRAYMFSCFCVYLFNIVYSAISRPINLTSYLAGLVFIIPVIFAFGIVGYMISWFLNYSLYKRAIRSYWAWFGLGLVVTFISIMLLILTLRGLGIVMAPFYILGGTCMSLSFPYWIKLVEKDNFELKTIVLERREYIDDLYEKRENDI